MRSARDRAELTPPRALAPFSAGVIAPEPLISVDFARRIAEHLAQDFLGVLAEQRRALHLARRVRQLDRIADGQILAARRMIDLDHGAGLAQRLLLGDLLHREDRPDRNVDRVAFLHDLELGHGHGPFLDRREDRLEARQARVRRRVVRIGLPLRLADQVADLAPHRRLGDEIDVGVGIGPPSPCTSGSSRAGRRRSRCRRAAPPCRTARLRRTGCIPSAGHGRGAAGRAASRARD